MPRIPLENLPMVQGRSGAAFASGAPGLDWRTQGPRALAQGAEALGRGLGALSAFLEKRQAAEDDLALADLKLAADEEYNAARERMQSSPGEYRSFGEWHREASENLKGRSEEILKTMSPRARERGVRYLAQRGEDERARASALSIQAGTTDGMNRLSAQVKAMVAAGDYDGARERCAFGRSSGLLTEDRALTMVEEIGHQEAFDGALAEVKHDPAGSLQVIDSGDFHPGLYPEDRARLKEFARQQEARLTADQVQAAGDILAETKGALPTVDELEKRIAAEGGPGMTAHAKASCVKMLDQARQHRQERTDHQALEHFAARWNETGKPMNIREVEEYGKAYGVSPTVVKRMADAVRSDERAAAQALKAAADAQERARRKAAERRRDGMVYDFYLGFVNGDYVGNSLERLELLKAQVLVAFPPSGPDPDIGKGLLKEIETARSRDIAALKEGAAYKAGVAMIQGMDDEMISPRKTGILGRAVADTDNAKTGEEFLKADLLQFLIHTPGASTAQVEEYLDKRAAHYSGLYLRAWMLDTFQDFSPKVHPGAKGRQE